jgi:hypothetical protein
VKNVVVVSSGGDSTFCPGVVVSLYSFGQVPRLSRAKDRVLLAVRIVFF